MTPEETLKLIEAGFTADEIRAMVTPPGDPKPEDPKPEDPKPKDPKPEDPKTEVSAEITNLTEQIAKLNDTVVKLQEANIKNARTGSPKVDDPVNDKIQEFIKGL